jgi:hypothetical protein
MPDIRVENKYSTSFARTDRISLFSVKSAAYPVFFNPVWFPLLRYAETGRDSTDLFNSGDDIFLDNASHIAET